MRKCHYCNKIIEYRKICACCGKIICGSCAVGRNCPTCMIINRDEVLISEYFADKYFDKAKNEN